MAKIILFKLAGTVLLNSLKYVSKSTDNTIDDKVVDFIDSLLQNKDVTDAVEDLVNSKK